MIYEKKLEEYINFFEKLNKDIKIDKYAEIYEEHIYFEDPFQKTYTLNSLYKIYEEMFQNLHKPEFKIKECAINQNIAYIQWTFSFKMNEKSSFESITGVSRVEFAENGKVISHIDYWDSSKNVFEKIPILRNILIFIKNKIKT